MTDPKPLPICGHCMRDIAPSETGVRHYGLHMAHAEHRCIYILSAEIAALRADARLMARALDQMVISKLPPRSDWLDIAYAIARHLEEGR